MSIYNALGKELLKNFDVFIVGCGLSGVVIGERICSDFPDLKVLIIEKRDHIGGNCYDYVDEATGILVSKYGPHIFHTKMDHVWKYVNTYDKFVRYDQQTLASVDNQFVPVPVNMITVNKLFNECIETEEDMNEWLERVQVPIPDGREAANSEEMCLSRVGELLYNKMFRPYTYKQWNKYPEQLKPEILARIPVRNNCDPRYFTDKYQALPQDGYTHFFRKILSTQPNLCVTLNTDFFDVKEEIEALQPRLIVYTGPIDYYYNSLGYEKLEYRSLHFELEYHFDTPFYQPASVVNYPGEEYPYTRITEYKHFLNRASPHTIIAKEFPVGKGDPYYPVLTDKNLALYAKYQGLASQEKDIVFVGRLANYKYFNMDQAIDNALKVYEEDVKIRLKIKEKHPEQETDGSCLIS